jgi:hypothetical protein
MKYQAGLYGNNVTPSSDKDGVIVSDNGEDVLIPSEWVSHERDRLFKPKEINLPWYFRVMSKERLNEILKKYYLK